MREIVGIVLMGALCACDREPILSPVPVSPANLRASLPEVSKTGGSMVKDDEGRAQAIHQNTNVELLPEPPKNRVQTSVNILVSQCTSNDASHCDLDGRNKHPLLYVDSGDAYYNPQWGSIGAVALGLGVLGGVAALETYCFVNCGTGGKVALVTVDVVSVVAGTILVLGFFAAVEHGLNN